MEESDESNDSSSDSDEVLEEVTFLPKADQRRSNPCTPIKSCPTQQKKDAQIIGSKLDMLLSSHQEEVRRDELHQRIKDELLNSIEQGSQEDAAVMYDTALNGEFAEHIEQLEVTTPELLTDQPRITIFCADNFCCLFKDNISPFSCGFSRSHFSKIDKVFATFRSDNLIHLLMSNTLPSCFHQVSSPHCIMLWLISLASIHSSSTVVNLISQNMTNIIQRLSDQQQGQEAESTPLVWAPKPIEITRILVNMGANPTYLLGDQALYSTDVIKEYLCAENDENDSMPTRSSGRVRIENCRSVLQILTRCFQAKPDYTKEEVTLMVCLVTRISVDYSFQSLELHNLFQDLLSSLLECYKDSDWPTVVPSLCYQLSSIPQHHRSSVYLVNLMPLTKRGNYIQVRFSYLLLCTTLDDERKDGDIALQLDPVSPSRICQLGRESSEKLPNPSFLFSCLHQLTKDDINKLDSAITLLDRAVGDETNRNAQPKDELDFLTNQVKMLIRDIRDSINTLDLSKIKDRMTIMTTKWMMMASQNTKSVQRSIFSWVTSRVSVQEERLEDSPSKDPDEEMDL